MKATSNLLEYLKNNMVVENVVLFRDQTTYVPSGLNKMQVGLKLNVTINIIDIVKAKKLR